MATWPDSLYNHLGTWNLVLDVALQNAEVHTDETLYPILYIV